MVVGYGIKIFWPGLFITSPDHLESLLQVLHVYAGCWTELTQSFLRTRLSMIYYR